MDEATFKRLLQEVIRAELKNYPTKDDLKAQFENYPTKQDLKAQFENYPTKQDLKAQFKNYPTKKDLESQLKAVKSQLEEYIHENSREVITAIGEVTVRKKDFEQLKEHVGHIQKTLKAV